MAAENLDDPFLLLKKRGKMKSWKGEQDTELFFYRKGRRFTTARMRRKARAS